MITKKIEESEKFGGEEVGGEVEPSTVAVLSTVQSQVL